VVLASNAEPPIATFKAPVVLEYNAR